MVIVLRHMYCDCKQTRHRASTSTGLHFAFVLCCDSNATRAPIANPPNVHN